ncbi:fatty acid desaturase [Ramlibacter sp. AN1133]|uniref:fatty acid desaturase n=1 Tax=Ramlibacter sp. AN1133 TaxID=3133429 RepID=UPI0030BD8EB6
MLNQLSFASGFATMFLVPGLLLLGILFDAPSLAFGMVMFVLPLARPLFGKLDPGSTPLWSERIATVLEALPLVYAGVLSAAVCVVLRYVASSEALDLAHSLGLGLSLWVTMLFATCVAHALIHRKATGQTMVGHYIAGVAGYPVLGHEHLRHHARPGDTVSAEWPRVGESVWHFAARRAVAILRSAYSPGSAFWSDPAPGRHVIGLRLATAVSLITCALFAYAGGWSGMAIYVGVLVAVTFGMQLFTYIQHWGLGDDRLGEIAARDYGWEDDCRLQSWMTLGISLHHAHHQSGHLPYYRVALTPDSPRLPAGYVVLMVLCLFPAQWRKLMLPALEHWQRNPNDPRSPGRALSCFSLYADRPAPGATG